MVSNSEIAVIFWGAPRAFAIVFAVLGGVRDAAWRAARHRAHEGAVRSRARRVTVPAPRPDILEVPTLDGAR
jgi:hypothetical protein